MNEAIIIAVVGSMFSLGGAYLAYRQSVKASERTARTAALQIEAGAFDRAKALYEAGISQLEAQVSRLRVDFAAEQDISNKLRVQVMEMENTIARLRRQMIHAGMELAPPAAGSSL
jgi:Tfp pilus assembly protein PilE